MSYNFSQLDNIKAKIFWTSLKYSIPKLIINFIAYFGSLVTIFSIRFIVNGAFTFSTSKFVDWLLIISLLSLLILGFIEIRKEIVKNFKSRVIVSRQQLFDLIATFRKDAEYSISNLSGDISWLRDDFEITKALREIKPDLKIEIFYDQKKVSRQTIELFKQYEDLSARFISYPSDLTPHTKSVLIDKEDSEKTVLLSFKKLLPSFFLSLGKNDLFEISIQRDYNNVEISSTIALVKALDYINSKLTIIGISGVNNVGKTTVVNKIKAKLNGNAEVIPDCFQDMGSNAENALLSIFIQINEGLKKSKKAKILVFDRTPVDNYCYYKLRNSQTDNILLKSKVIEIMRRFDLIFDLRKTHENYTKPTKLVTGEERKFVRDNLSDIYNENNFSNRKKYEIDHSLPDSFDKIANEIYSEIIKIQRMKEIKQ